MEAKAGNSFTPYYYHADGLGSITGLSDATGTMVQTYGYDAFGNVTVSGSGNVAQPFMFTGREYDAETGMYFYCAPCIGGRARYYDPVVGRFVTKDPIGFEAGDVNLFSFVLNDPVNYYDPEGLQTIALPGPIPLPIVLPTPQSKQLDEAYRQAGNDAVGILDWLSHQLYEGGIGEGLYDLINAPMESRRDKYTKPENPNKRKGADERKQCGERERNVGHPDGEEHNRVPKGPKGPRRR